MLKKSSDDPPPLDPGRFSDLANTDLGRKVWRFLNERENVHKMIAVSDVGKPAVAGLGSRDHLVNLLGPEVATDRWKQVIGFMVRQIMEREPFELVSQGQLVKVSGDSMFSKGSRYKRRRPHWGHMYLIANRSASLLWSDLGVDSLDHALTEIEAFLRVCIAKGFHDAKFTVSERGVSHSRPATKTVTLKVTGSGLSAAQTKELRAVLGVGTLAPNIDVRLTLPSDD